MPRERVFLGCSQTALPAVAQRLILRSRSAHFCDLGHLIAVLPGREAGRRLMELLTEGAQGQLIPPRILTQGSLPEELYPSQRPFAPDLVQQMVWAQALQNVPPQVLGVVVRQPPESEDWQAWLRLGNLLRRQHEELAADQLDFADVARLGSGLEGFDEVRRWQALSEVQKKYWERLDELELWDKQTARLVAIRQHECRTDKEIVTIGTVDLNKTMRAMLDQVADQVTAYIDAPEEWSDRFDDFGCLIPEKWTDLNVDLSSEQIVVTEDGPGQVETILGILAELNGQYAIEQIAIGVPDERLVPQIQRSLQAEQIATYWPVDRLLETTGPYRLLEAAADYLEDRRTEHFSALIRHPDVSQWIQSQQLPVNWLTGWDQYVGTALLPRISGVPEESEDWWIKIARQLISVIHRLLAPLTGGSVQLSRIADPVREFLLSIYGKRMIDPAAPEQVRIQKSLIPLQEAFEQHATLPAPLDQEVSVVEGIRLTLSITGGALYRVPAEPAIRIAGWLEMPLDDAPVAILTTFNEGFVPSSVNHDLFLPNRLRTHLGIEDNNRRYARDLYNLACMTQSRELLRLIVPRRDALNEPLTPSRLIFATEEEKIPDRVIQFYSHAQGSSGRNRPVLGKSQFKIPRPAPRTDLPEAFRVTEFRDYLASPYRYYLRHVLKLSEISDAISELDGRAFGTLIHDVLKAFGQSDVRHATQEVEIAGFLNSELDHSIRQSYGTTPMASVLIQAEQAKR
ncbi:MAG TPA: PD-(D/E)XK nuclease family protein, partial [Planctomicrobium sp.]|nr:PD-(D/E)XK nuclease family protein [Planctomicrobium sp.]